MAGKPSFRFAVDERLCEYCRVLEIPVDVKTAIDLEDKLPALPKLTDRAQSCDLCSLLLQILRAKDRLRPSFSVFAADSDKTVQLVITAKQRSLLGSRPKLAGSIHVQAVDTVEGRPIPMPKHAEAILPFASVSKRAGRSTTHSESPYRSNAIEQACIFVDKCAKSHDRKRDHYEHDWNSARRPTRLLHIINPEILRLDVASGANPKYAALSYRWGPPPFPHSTTGANLAERIVGFPIADLPRTIKCAIEVLRKLGLEYLWVDSLCIIQDDENDWQKEASRMHLVYSHA